MSSNTNTSQLVDKNTYVRWFLTNDEAWTKKIKSRSLDAKNSTIMIIFPNGLETSVMLGGINLNGGNINPRGLYNITDSRRVIEGMVERDSEVEAECNICNHELVKCGRREVSCNKCLFKACGDCQRKTMVQHGYIECPGCREMLLGEVWYKKFFEEETVDPVDRMRANQHWVRYLDEVLALSRWNARVKRGKPTHGMIKPTPDRFLAKSAEEAISLLKYLLE